MYDELLRSGRQAGSTEVAANRPVRQARDESADTGGQSAGSASASSASTGERGERSERGETDATRFVVSHWISETARAWNVRADDDRMLVALCLRQALSTLSANDTAFYAGVIDRGAMIVVPPGCDFRGVYHTPTEFLYLRVPPQWLTEWLDHDDAPDAGAMLGDTPLHIRDAVVIKLTGTLLLAGHGQAAKQSRYANGIVLSILARLMEVLSARVAVKPARASSVSPLEAWRVKVAIDFIDQRIDRSLTLAELGASVGLSPMHFAARFRAATGHSPHTFILRRRIEHAQRLLATTRSTVADVAFSVGFRTQAHFTTVFRRHVDDTPHRWRAKHGAAQRATVRSA
jgi:AraC family transcriptional regulator